MHAMVHLTFPHVLQILRGLSSLVCLVAQLFSQDLDVIFNLVLDLVEGRSLDFLL